MENKVVCGANADAMKYYLNPEFEALPDQIREELRIMCVLFVEEIGGMLYLEFAEDGELLLNWGPDGDLFYDDISAGLKAGELRRKNRDLFEQLEMYYKAFFLGGLDEIRKQLGQ